MMRRLLAAVVFLCVSSIALARGPATSVEGAWKVVETVITGTNPATNSNPQPGLYLFTKTHYSTVVVTSPTVRKGNPSLADPSKATDAEKSARYDEWAPFIANSGTYEIKGTTLITHPVVAKNAGFMASASPTIIGFKLEGNTLTLTQKTQPGPLGLDIRIKLVRAE